MDLLHRTEKYATSLDGTKIFYTVSSGKNNHYLVFLHGLGEDGRVWDTERKALFEYGYSTIAIDLRGHGLSQRPTIPGAYYIDNFFQDILAVLKQENIQRHIIVGHSFGGMVALGLEAHYPATTKGIILIDSSYKAPVFGEKIAHHRILNQFVSLLSKNAPTAHTAEQINWAKLKGTSDFSARRIISDVVHTSLRSYLEVCEEIMHFNAKQLLKRIHVPVLVITGSNDLVFPPEVAIDLADRIKNVHVSFIDGGNHMTVINNPQDLIIEIKRFLTAINY